MKVSTYPAQADPESPAGAIRKLLKKLSGTHPRLFALVNATIMAIEGAKDLSFLEASGRVERLPHCAEPIHIWLLSAELKHGTNKDDPEKIETAIRQYRVLCKCKENTR